MAAAYTIKSISMIYPGEYIPLVKPETLSTELKKQNKSTELRLPVNIREHAEHFHIELATPGLKREDFFISTDDNILSVAVLQKERGRGDPGSFRLQEFNYNCFKDKIVLPENVDTQFVVAEYKRGVLHLYVPKTEQAGRGLHTRIIVY